MFVAVIKCDLCQKKAEVPCRKAIDGPPQIPDGWATISPLIHIKGTPKEKNQGRGVFAADDPVKQKHYKARRDALRAKFDKNHACEDCIEQIITGKISLKIGQN